MEYLKFDNISSKQWNDWKWQLRNSLKTEQELLQLFSLSKEEIQAFTELKTYSKRNNNNNNNHRALSFSVQITPYYAKLIANTDNTDNANIDGKAHINPLRRMSIPQSDELLLPSVHHQDPLGENKYRPTPRIIHRYSDRLIYLVTGMCALYCRYCTRKHFTNLKMATVSNSNHQQAMQYIKSHPGVREVILSGGDPFTLSDEKLIGIIKDIRSIKHVEVIRIGTRMPAVCPMRINKKFAKQLRAFAPLFVLCHFNHPKELTLEATKALSTLIDHGIPCLNQMVLLNGVNNHHAIVQALNRRLLSLRVLPYYMFQCDPSPGTEHLRTSIDESLAIQKTLWGHLSNLALPQLSLDIPDGGGKAYYVPSFETHNDIDKRSYCGWDGITSDYINPPSNKHILPNDWEQYQNEWDLIVNESQIKK